MSISCYTLYSLWAYLGGLGGKDVIEEKLNMLVDCVEDELVVVD